MPISFDQFLSKSKISEITAQAYKQDIESFLNLIYKKNKNLSDININDISEYIDHLKKECLSTAYALRRLGVLKLFCKFIMQEYELPDYSYLINNLEIPKFPIFCSTVQIANYIRTSNATDYLSLRNKLLVTLLFNYELSVKEVSKLTFENFSLENNTLKIYKNKKFEYYKLKVEDQVLIEKYKTHLLKYNSFNFKNYIFPITRSSSENVTEQLNEGVTEGLLEDATKSFSSESMPLQALWSLLKKMFFTDIKQDIFNYDVFNHSIKSTDIETELLKIDYIKKHPRAQV